MRRAGRIVVVLACMSSGVGLAQGQTAGEKPANQIVVCCGSAPFDQPVRLPKQFVYAWLGSKMASGLRGMLRDDPHLQVDSFYAAYRVKLTSSNDLAYIVEGRGNPVTGADNDWFWVVGTVAAKPAVVLFCGALNLAILPGVHDSLRDIRCTWESPGGDGFIEDYRFNRQTYVLFRKSETHRRP